MTNEQHNTARSAAIITISMILARILGFVRDIAIYAQFGQGRYSDAYQAAFSIPDFIYMILVGGGFSAAFIPVFSHYIAKNQKKEAWEVASIVLNVILIFLLVLIAFAYIFAPQLLHLIVKDFDAEKLNLTVFLTRIMLLQVIFMALAGVASGVLQSQHIFGPTAWGGVVYNFAIIVIGVCFGGFIESLFPGYGIAAFSIGVVIGALGNFLIQWFSLRKVGMHYVPSLNLRHPGFKKIVILMVPVLIGLSANELSLFVNLRLASGLDDGLLSALRTAQRFMQLPISIFAISIAMTLFPVLNQEAAQNKMAEFRNHYATGMRNILFICIPCSVLLTVLGTPVIRLLFEGGRFTPTNTTATAFTLNFYVIGIFAQGGIHLTSRAFYALQNTYTPVKMAVIGIGINIALSILLLSPLAQGGLALAYSIAGIVNLGLLLIALRRKIGLLNGRAILYTALKTLAISLAAGLFAWFAAYGSEMVFGITAKWAQAVQATIGGIIGLIIFFVLAKLLKMKEAEAFFARIKRRFFRST